MPDSAVRRAGGAERPAPSTRPAGSAGGRTAPVAPAPAPGCRPPAPGMAASCWMLTGEESTPGSRLEKPGPESGSPSLPPSGRGVKLLGAGGPGDRVSPSLVPRHPPALQLSCRIVGELFGVCPAASIPENCPNPAGWGGCTARGG